MKHPNMTLISHHLCPYVQRVSIALDEKGVGFERRNIDLSDKPDWFLELSPLGKVPVLVVNDDTVLFESSAIAQYVDEVTGGGLLSSDPLKKSQQLAWMEFASQVIGNIGQLYNATDATFDAAKRSLTNKLLRLEERLGDGLWFAGDQFTLVDAAFAPAFRYFDVIDDLIDGNVFAGMPKVAKWRSALSDRLSVKSAVDQDYAERLLTFFANRNSLVGRSAQAAVVGRTQAAFQIHSTGENHESFG